MTALNPQTGRAAIRGEDNGGEIVLTHEELEVRAQRWLRGHMRCDPVFSRCASCREIPDAIGWTSWYKFHGSVVVECKASRSDFMRDEDKYIEYRDQWGPVRSRSKRGMGPLERRILPRMGDFRYYLCAPGVIQPEAVETRAKDHGLLYVEGRRVRIVKEPTRRENVDYASEVRFLRFAILNGKYLCGKRRRDDGSGSTAAHATQTQSFVRLRRAADC